MLLLQVMFSTKTHVVNLTKLRKLNLVTADYPCSLEPSSFKIPDQLEMRLTACKWFKIWISIYFQFRLVHCGILMGSLYAPCLQWPWD